MAGNKHTSMIHTYTHKQTLLKTTHLAILRYRCAGSNAGYRIQSCKVTIKLLPWRGSRVSGTFGRKKHYAKFRGGSKGPGEHRGTPPPKKPSNFYEHNTTSSCTILQVYGHCGEVSFKRLALLGSAAIVHHFAGSGART